MRVTSCIFLHIFLTRSVDIQAGSGHQAAQSSMLLCGNESDLNPFQSHQVSTGAEYGQDQRRDHVEPLCPGYEVRHGRSVMLPIRQICRVHVCVCVPVGVSKSTSS